MGVSLVSRMAVRHAHVLLVEVPGHWPTRVAAERHVLQMGWRLALSPADADVLAFCGPPGPELTVLVGRLWDELPGPRARVTLDSPQAVPSSLAAAESELLDTARQLADSRSRPTHPEVEGHAGMKPGGRGGGDHAGHGEVSQGNHGDMGHHGMRQAGQPTGHGQVGAPSHGGMQHGAHGGTEQTRHGDEDPGRHPEMRHGGMEHGDPAGHENEGHGGEEHGTHPAGHAAAHGQMNHGGMAHGGHGGMSHGGHGGMSHGGMDMTPGGIPLAQGGEDRDGLEMDVLHVLLGPVLPYWPAGVVVRCTLQGDLIIDAESRVIDPGDFGRRGEAVGARRHAAVRCDNAAGLLALAGWEHAAGRARRIRDGLLCDTDMVILTSDLDRLRRTVRRSWLLKRSLRGLGQLTAHELAHHDLPGTLEGDVRDRLVAMLDAAAQSMTGQRAPGPRHPARVDLIADLVRGWDLATARLIVASLDLDPLAVDYETSHA